MKQCLRWRTIGTKIQNKKFKNLAPGTTKKIIKKAFLEPKLIKYLMKFSIKKLFEVKFKFSWSFYINKINLNFTINHFHIENFISFPTISIFFWREVLFKSYPIKWHLERDLLNTLKQTKIKKLNENPHFPNCNSVMTKRNG